MAAKDYHIALRTKVLIEMNVGDIEIILAKLQWGKDDAAYTLHVSPSALTSGGLKTLQMLGFKENARCQFSQEGRCLSGEVPEAYDPQRFAAGFGEAISQLHMAEKGLQACGIWRPEQSSATAMTQLGMMVGTVGFDGHMAMKTRFLKASEDDKFRYHFTSIDTGRVRGLVTHYRPRHPPLSSEIRGVFGYLGLKEYRQCPEFDFEACHYSFTMLDSSIYGVLAPHKFFNAHAAHFSPAIEALLAANAATERIGLSFLPMAGPAERFRDDIVQRIRPPTNSKSRSNQTMAFDPALPSNFDVAISFAGSDRELAEKLAELLRAAGVAVFYDNFYPEHLWGKNLTAFLDEIYRKRAKYCVVFVSAEYKERKWTVHELRSAQAKALEQKGDEYILPVKVDDTELDGLPPNVGYIGISLGIEKIAELLIRKLKG